MNQTEKAYERIQRLIAAQQCVVLDGGVSTELERVGSGPGHHNVIRTRALARSERRVNQGPVMIHLRVSAGSGGWILIPPRGL